MQSHRNLRLLGWFSFFLDLRFFASVLVIYFARISGSYARALALLSIVMVVGAALDLPTGVLSDFVGRKRLLILGAWCVVVATVLYAWAASYSWLVLGAVAEGASRACFNGNNEALIFDSLAEDGREAAYGSAYGRTRAMSQGALAICALAGGIIAMRSLRAVMWLSVFPQVLVLLTTFLLVEPRRTNRGSDSMVAHFRAALGHMRKNRPLRWISASSILGFALGESAFQFTPVFVNTLWPLWAVGLWGSLSHFGAFLTYRSSGRFVRFGRELPVLVIAKVVDAILDIPAVLVPTVVSPLMMALTSLPYGPSEVATESLLQQEFTSAQRATLGSLNSFAGSCLFGIVSVALGLLADHLGARLALLVIQVAALSRLVIYWRLGVALRSRQVLA